ncbi:hypothetical protein [Anaerorudis cellulosivorans]|uniref:hypothetical protein n=1 Tax=Anaerorudis cellulosivorans TaxID=3397862 RepID=UPI00221E5008|nr:hypothetical protein [Seramator thermalis]MCW1734199.1 hypothetical protein [Seramator thermalis]
MKRRKSEGRAKEERRKSEGRAKEERRKSEGKVGIIYLIEQKAGETTSDKSSLASEKLAVSNKNVVEFVTFCPNKG